jgi:OpgC protein
MTYVLFAALIMWAHDWPLAGLAPQFLVDLFTAKALEELTPYRIVHLIALLCLFTRAFPREWREPDFRLLRPVLLCGEEWLPVFCTGVFLSLQRVPTGVNRDSQGAPAERV